MAENFKEVISNDFNKDSNYQIIMTKINKVNKKPIRYKYIVSFCTIFLLFGLIYFKYLPNPTTVSNNNKKNDNYFVTKVFANNKAYDLKKGNTINFSKEPISIENFFYSFAYDYSGVDDNGNEFTGAIFINAIKLNLSIEGDNVDKIIYEINSPGDKRQIFQAISGELSDKSICKGNSEDITGKQTSDLSIEEKQHLLDLIGYSEKKATDFTENEFTRFYYETAVNKIFDISLDPYCISGEDDKTLGFLEWDTIKKGTVIEIPKDQQAYPYTLFLATVPTKEDRQSLSNGVHNAPSSNPDNYEYTNDNIAKSIAQDTTITIKVVYKNGITHVNTLSFNLIEKEENGYKYYTLQGVIK